MLARILGFVAIGSLAASGASARECRVTDPTGTPLNVRSSPNGRIVGSLGNGQSVAILDGRQVGGKAWVYVGDGDAGDQPIGWVFREFVSCFGR